METALLNRSPRRAAMTMYNQHQATRTFVMGFAYKLAKKVTPKISATEAAALDAGTVGFDRELFGGNPSLQQLKTNYDLKVGWLIEAPPIGWMKKFLCWVFPL